MDCLLICLWISFMIFVMDLFHRCFLHDLFLWICFLDCLLIFCWFLWTSSWICFMFLLWILFHGCFEMLIVMDCCLRSCYKWFVYGLFIDLLMDLFYGLLVMHLLPESYFKWIFYGFVLWICYWFVIDLLWICLWISFMFFLLTGNLFLLFCCCFSWLKVECGLLEI